MAQCWGAAGDSGADTAGGLFELEGAVHKGPFIQGSTITINALQPANFQPTGDVYNSTTDNHYGEFSALLPDRNPVSISGTGFYYDEVHGRNSTANLTLRALFDPPPSGDVAPAYVNLMTHLTAGLTQDLLADGSDFETAVATAEAALVEALDIGPSDFTLGSIGGTDLNVVGDNSAENAYIVALSAVLIQTATARGATLDASLQELLNYIEANLADDGTIGGPQAADILADVQTAETAVDFEAVSANLNARVTEVEPSRDLDGDPLPDINAILDSDNDDVANNNDNCLRVANTDRVDTDDDGAGDVCDMQFERLGVAGAIFCGIHGEGSFDLEGNEAAAGDLFCWHLDRDGIPSPSSAFQTSSLDDSEPPPEALYDTTIIQFIEGESQAHGYGFPCALSTDGEVTCWSGFASECEGCLQPEEGTTYSEIAGADQVICGIRSDEGSAGDLSCWGTQDEPILNSWEGPYEQVAAGGFSGTAIRV